MILESSFGWERVCEEPEQAGLEPCLAGTWAARTGRDHGPRGRREVAGPTPARMDSWADAEFSPKPVHRREQRNKSVSQEEGPSVLR